MSEQTAIEWCDHTFNPWWGCIEVSPACDNCYARTWATFTGHKVWGAADETPRRFFGDKHWAEPLKWQRKAEEAGERRRVFCASMADVFEQNEALDPHRMRLWDLIDATPNLDWLLLTKRPQNIRHMVPTLWLDTPRENVWYGTTVENQHYADQRIPILLGVPAAVRFLSMEPLLGPVNLFSWDEDEGAFRGPAVVISGGMTVGTADFPPEGYDDSYSGIHWVITGGESGNGARPAHPDWYRSLRDQCVAAGVAFHFKQWGEWAPAERLQATHLMHPSGTFGPRAEFTQDYPYGLSSGRDQDLVDRGHPGWARLYRPGKKAAGRLLDGREWNEFPESAAPPAPAAAPMPSMGEAPTTVEENRS